MSLSPISLVRGPLPDLIHTDSLVASDVEHLVQTLATYVPARSQTAKRILDHAFNGGGKRIRPTLYFLCCRMLNYRGEHLYPIAAVTEYVHTASLLHDDVVDNSTLRRNKPTANSIWGDEAGVLVGDLIYSTASELMAATGNMEIVKTFARAIRLMSEGELLQLENVFNVDISESTYMHILEYKTATLIAAACKSAALLAGSTKEVCHALSNFGYNLGLAFQLIDDALDYTGSERVVGKPILNDLQEGKVTLPIILLAQLSTLEEKRLVRSIVAKDAISINDVAKIAKQIEKYKTADKTVSQAHVYTNKAIACLHELPKSPSRDQLENLARQLLFRFH